MKTPPVAWQGFTLDIQPWLTPDLTTTPATLCCCPLLTGSLRQRHKEPVFFMESGGRWYRERGSGARQWGYIYDGGWVILKCSANHHLCIFGLGLSGLWVLWAARQRWNRKEKCSWKRMRRLRAPDLWNSSLQMKCTLHSGLFFPSIFSISC